MGGRAPPPERTASRAHSGPNVIARIAIVGISPAAPLPRPPEGYQPTLNAERPTTLQPATEEVVGLPSRVRDLVGRTAEVGELSALLDRARVVTVVGLGGSGKSCVAAAVALERRASYRDGAWFVEVGDDPVAALAAVWQRVGNGNAGAVDDVVAAVADRELLLVLDGAEQAPSAVADIVSRLVERPAAPDVLVTCRHPLGIPGERVWPVPPLHVPDPDTEDADPSADAVALFERRAREAAPDFTLRDDEVAVVADICRLLDGSPIAIELVAARTRVLDIRQIAARLGDRDQLFGGEDTAPLHQAVAWSYDAAAPPERLLLARLAVLEDTFDLDDAEALGSGDTLPRASVLDVLSRLVSRSLVTVVDGLHELRYRLPGAVRAFALDRLAERGELTHRRDLHARRFLDLAEEHTPASRDPASRGDRAAAPHGATDRTASLRRLVAAEADLAAATRWALETGAAELALRLVVALGPLWRLRRFDDGAALARDALALDGAAPPALQGRALVVRGALAAPRDARRALADAETLAQRHHDPALASEAAAVRAARDLDDGDVEAAHSGFLRASEQAPSASARAWADYGLARVHAARGASAEAATHANEALDGFRGAHDVIGAMHGLGLLGDLASMRGDGHAATALHRQALEAARRLGAREEIAGMLEALARDARAAGHVEAAADQFAHAHQAWRRLGDPRGQARTAVALATALRDQGERLNALDHFHRALRLTAADGSTAATATTVAALAGVAALAIDGEEPRQAAVLCAAATALAQRADVPAPGAAPTDPLPAALQRWLEPHDLDRLTQEGSQLSRDEAIAVALAVDEGGEDAVLATGSVSHPVRRQLDDIGERRELRFGGIRLSGRRRRPSGEREPLPREFRGSGRVWLIVTIATAALWASLFAFPATADWWTQRDLAVLEWLVALRTDVGVEVARAVHAFGSPWFYRPLRWGILVVLALFRRWRHLAAALLALLVLETVVDVMTTAIGRPRPLVPLLAPWEGYAHPSGPVASLAVTLAVGALVLVGAGRWRRRAVVASGLAIAVLGAARLYLGVDHPTDVLVAGLLGPAIAVMTLRVLAPEAVFPVTYRRARGAHLDIGGRRGQAIRHAVKDQLGLEVEHLEHFGLEASGGSTPLRLRVAGSPEQWLFGKLYSTSHLRADRWYKAGRTILYGSLEDEVRYTSVRRLVEAEDYMLLTMREAGIPCARPYGIVEITPEREYLILTEFILGAREISEADVDDDVIDQALLLVRRLWDAGLAHRDIKPGNVLVQDGRVRLIDVAFGMIRPSPWRQAVDLANMMLILALRTDAERVYERALRLFAPEDIAEAFAATRSVTIPSQSRSSLRVLARTQGMDLVERFRELSPRREPITIQRWSRRRIGLTVGAVIGALVVLNLLVLNLFGAGFI